MTRVSTFAHNTALVNQLLRNEAKVAADQQQVTTGKKAQDFSGIQRDLPSLVGAQSRLSRVERFLINGNELKTRLDSQDFALDQAVAAANQMRQLVLEAVSSESGLGLLENAEVIFDRFAAAMNTKVGDQFIFAGTNTLTAPVTPRGLADLDALAATADAFTNNDVKQSMLLEDDLTVEFGQVASEVGQGFMDSLKQFADFVGPPTQFSNPLTAAEKTFLTGLLDDLESGRNQLLDAQALNGIRQRQLDEIRDTQETTVRFLETFISDIEDVDMAEAITNLQQDQVAVDASLRVLAQLTRTSLVDLI